MKISEKLCDFVKEVRDRFQTCLYFFYEVFFSFLPPCPPLEGDMGEGVLCVSAVSWTVTIMSDHLITEILKLEEDADRIVNEARLKAREIIANVHHETESIETTCENEYRQKLEIIKARIAELQKSEEEGLRNESELLKKKILNINSKSIENAVTWVVKHIYES